MKDTFPGSFLIVGNVATSDAVEDIQEWGISAVKCGIGAGSSCITRIKTGFYRPMVSTLLDCVSVAHIPVIADGGISKHGDVAKAISLGCFTEDCNVVTDNGKKKIKDILTEDMVYTHDGKLQKVKKVMKKRYKGKIIKINGIECTPNHEFYVIKKSDKNKINEINIKEYAKWIPSSELTKDYFLIKLKT